MTPSPAELLKTAFQLRLLSQKQINECAHKFKAASGKVSMEKILLDGFLKEADLERIAKLAGSGARIRGPSPAELLKAAFQLRLLSQKQLNECAHRFKAAVKGVSMEEVLLEGFLKPDQIERVKQKIQTAATAPAKPAPARQSDTEIRRAAAKPADAPARQSDTEIRRAAAKREGTAIRKAAAMRAEKPDAAPAAEPPKKKKPNLKRRAAFALAGLVLVVGGVAAGAWKLGLLTVPERPHAAGPGPTVGPAPNVGPAAGPGPAPSLGQEAPTVPHDVVPGDDAVAADWNRLMRRTPGAPELDDMPYLLNQSRNILEAARQAQHPGLASMERTVAALRERARFLLNGLYEETYQQAQGLVREHKYGEAIQALEWFPLDPDVDVEGQFARSINTERERILDAARHEYEGIKTEADQAVASGDTEAAKAALQRAIAFGVDEIADDAHNRLEAVNRAELAGVHEGAERDLEAAVTRVRSGGGGSLDRADQASLEALQQGRPEAGVDAMANLVLYAEGHPIDARFVRVLERVYKEGPFDARARRLYEETRGRDAENAASLAGLVSLLIQLGESDRAVEVVQDAPRRALSGELGGLMGQISRINRSSMRQKVREHTYQRGNYMIWTDTSVDRAHEIAEFMNRLYGEYGTVFPYPKNNAFVFRVLVFKEQRDFNTYRLELFNETDIGRAGRVDAFYYPTTKELVLHEEPNLENVARHEAFHQFVDFYVGDCPMWFNEGFASYFESSTATEPRMNDGRIQEYLLGAPGNIRQRGVREIMMMTRSGWEAGGNAVWWYGASWSVIYYLMTHDGEQRLKDYFAELVGGGNPQQAFDRIFAGDEAALATAWRQWLEGERRRLLQGPGN